MNENISSKRLSNKNSNDENGELIRNYDNKPSIKQINIESNSESQLFNKKNINLSSETINDDICKLQEDLEKVYEQYCINREKVFPVSVLDSENIHFKHPQEQMKQIDNTIKIFDEFGQNPKLFTLYADNLHYNLMDKLKYKNSVSEVKELFRNHFILKYFRLLNAREKIISKASNIIHFNGLDEKFIIYKDYKIGILNTEIDFTLKRILRLTQTEEKRNKDYEYYLKHFKLKKLDTVFLKNDQSVNILLQQNFHSQLRRDDFEVFFREQCYRVRINHHIKNFEPYIRFIKLISGINIWKNSKILGKEIQSKIYNEQMNKLKSIYSNEKNKCPPSDIKLFKEYFKEKYKFYYDLKNKMDDKNIKLFNSYNYDIVFPPIIISINSEISFNIKELCDYFQIQFDITIDKGKAFSYSIDMFFPKYFKQQTNNFTYNPYELTYSDLDQNETNAKEVSSNREERTTEVLRNTYNLKEGFLVNNEDKFGNIFKNPSSNNLNFIKKASWIKYVCIQPAVDQNYISLKKKLDQLGYVDSLLKFELQLIEAADYNTMIRLIEDYTHNISTRIRNTIKLTKSKEDTEFKSLREIVKNIIGTEKKKKVVDEEEYVVSDEYAEKVDSDLLKYYLILRFLKLRDIKFYILNVLNYFRYIQKKFALDLYKMENKNMKKSKDLINLTNGNLLFKEVILNTMKVTEKPGNENLIDVKNFLSQIPLSEYSKTNPIIPPMEYILEGKKSLIILDEINETIEYSEKVIRIKDSKGNFIIYDATLSDLKQLEMDLEKIGTYYINKHEVLIINTDNTPNPLIDRSQVILDIFQFEFEFLYSKYELISDLMTVYDNNSDVYSAKSLMQLIIDVMSKRPNLDLSYKYFSTGYILEIEVIKKKAAFIHTLIDYQKKVEFNENKLIHDSIEKTYWILGEVALDIIKHIRMDKREIEILKKMIVDKENKDEDSTMMETLLDVFENLPERENDNFDIKKFIKKCQDEENIIIQKIPLNEEVENINNDSPQILRNEKISVDQPDHNNKLYNRFKVFIMYLRKIFSMTLTNNTNILLENSADDILKSDSDQLQEIKEIVNNSIQELDKSNLTRKHDTTLNRSNSILNTSVDLINYKVRSLLNLPNPINENKFMKVIEKNPSIVKTLNKDINFIKFEEGYPQKFHESEENTFIPQIEFCDSLSIILPIFNLIENTFGEISQMFKNENFAAIKLLELSYFDELIDEWDKYKEYISGRIKNAEFNEIYFFQDSILDDHQLFLYSIKLLVATLGGNITRIPPNILMKLPIKLIEKIEFEKFEFKVFDYLSSSQSIESIVLNDLNIAVLEHLKNDISSQYLNLSDNTELSIYCNAVEAFNCKKLATRLSSLCTYLTRVYENQKKTLLNRQDNLSIFKENLNFDLSTSLNKYIDYLPASNSLNKLYPPKFPISEFDPTFQNCIDIHNLSITQTNFLDKGLEELKSFIHYQYTHYYLLLIGTQINNVFLFEPMKLLAEIDLIENYNIVSFHRLIDTSIVTWNENVDNINYYKLKNKINSYLGSIGKEQFYNILNKKNKNRNTSQTKFVSFKESIKFINKSNYVKIIYQRYFRLMIMNAYCQDILFDVYLDAIKLQTCTTTQNLQNLLSFIPKEYDVIEKNIYNFLDTDLHETPNSNIQFFSDNSKTFNNFCIPNYIDILGLENRSDADTIIYYKTYNPFLFRDDINYKFFFDQIKERYFNTPTPINKLENYRNYFFQEAYEYRSNILLLLQISNFLINFINFKFLEISMTQKSMELLKIYESNENGIDFWGDKNIDAKLNYDKNEKLPIIIVDKIIQNQTNFVNIRREFEKFKNDMTTIIEDIKILTTHNEPHLAIKQYLHSSQFLQIVYLLNIYERGMESSLINEDLASVRFLSNIIQRFTTSNFYRSNTCNFPVHFSQRILKLFKETNYCFYGIEHSILDLDNTLKKHLHLNKDDDINDILNQITPSFEFLVKESLCFEISDYNHYSLAKYDILNLSEKRMGELRNFSFKLQNNLEKYMIYLEISRFNTDLTEINNRKILFLQYYLKLIEHKIKFLIIYFKKLIPLDPIKYKKMLATVKPLFKKIPENLEDLDKINENYLRNIKISDNKLLKTKIEINFSITDKKSQKENLKLDDSVVIEIFIHLINHMFELYRKETKIQILKNNINLIRKDNLALIEAINCSKNDLSIVKFKNEFSSSLTKELDEANITSINKKFSFFEGFVNKILNISIECDTHTNSTAILILKSEWEESIKNMIREYLIYETNQARSDKILYCSEKFGYYLNLKKLELKNEFISKRLHYYDNNLDRISNAKLAFTGNKMVFEMDNLYRQLKVLKDNLVIMEDYIRKYFEECFKNEINKMKTEKEETEAKFVNYKNELASETIQLISNEYRSNLGLLKNKNAFLTEILEAEMKRKEEDYIQQDIFYKEMELERKFTVSLNEERNKNEKLVKTIANLHSFYRFKLHLQKVKNNTKVEELKNVLSSNKDLWDKLGISEKNEKILKEELSKTQKNLAATEEFIKRLQQQIRKSHDKNVDLEKQLTNLAANKIIQNAGNGEKVKTKELYQESKQMYIYNLKDNVNVVTAIERIKIKYKEEKDVQLLLENFELIQNRYTQEVENKRNYINLLNKIKDDVANLKSQETIKYKELEEKYMEAIKEIAILKHNNNNSDKNDVNNNSQRYSIDFESDKSKNVLSQNLGERNFNMTRQNFSVDKHFLPKENFINQKNDNNSKKNQINLKKNTDKKTTSTDIKLNFRVLGQSIMGSDKDKI